MTFSTPLPVFDADADASFQAALAGAGLSPLRAVRVDTLQVNVGKRCNQACKHCHVDAEPQRTEEMTRETAEEVIAALARSPGIGTLDITGGAPELNANFRDLVAEAKRLGRHVMDRCNLTVLFEPGQEDTAQFLRDNEVEVVASLPYYLSQRTDSQRGAGVFEKSVEGLRLLNSLGYGRAGGPALNLAYNPTGAFLPPAQAGVEAEYRRELDVGRRAAGAAPGTGVAVEAEYRRELDRRHGIVFTSLYTITNMPIARFRHFLDRSGNYARYMDKLAGAFNPASAANVMCRSLLSVGYDGRLWV